MKPITNEMLASLIKKIQSGRQQPTPQTKLASRLGIPGTPIIAPIDAMTLSLMGRLQSPAESTTDISKLTAALALLSSDVGYGSGRFYDSNGRPEVDYWLAGIWAVASLNWKSGKDIARKWSEQSDRYTDDGFEKAWNSYNSAHANGIGIGSLYKRAKELGLTQEVTQPQFNTTNLAQHAQRFTLLGIDDLAALPPADYLIKGVLPSCGWAAI